MNGNNIKKMYEEIESLFPKQRKKGMLEERVLYEEGFRIGLSCILVSEKRKDRYDVGLWYNYPTGHMDLRKGDLSYEEAVLWFKEKAIAAHKHREKERDSDIESRVNFAVFTAVVLLVLYFYFYLP